MTDRKARTLDRLPAGLRPARWLWFHTAGLVVTLLLGGLIVLFPADAAAMAGTVVLDWDNAMYLRVGLIVLALWVAFVVRGQPPHVVGVCVLIAAFLIGQVLRAEFSADSEPVTASLLFADLAVLWLLMWLLQSAKGTPPHTHTVADKANIRCVRRVGRNAVCKYF